MTAEGDSNDKKSSEHSELRADDLTDGREVGAWKTRYPREARTQYFLEALYTTTVSVAAVTLLLLAWTGRLSAWLGLQADSAETFERFCYYAFAGMLGGTVFDTKFLYRVVARGYWNEDRRLWRVLSPWLSFCIALVFGAIIESGLIAIRWMENNPGRLVLGFLVGYFSDSALAKMHELAEVIFGPAKRRDEGKQK